MFCYGRYSKCCDWKQPCISMRNVPDLYFILLARQQLPRQQQGREAQGEIQVEAKEPQSWQHLVKNLGLPVQAWTQTWPSLFDIFIPARPAAISYTFNNRSGYCPDQCPLCGGWLDVTRDFPLYPGLLLGGFASPEGTVGLLSTGLFWHVGTCLLTCSADRVYTSLEEKYK